MDKPTSGRTAKTVLTDEQIQAIDPTSQEFAELSTADKLRFYQLQNAALLAKQKALEATRPDEHGLRVTDKGGLLYQFSMKSWPATFYRDQWLEIDKAMPHIRKRLETDSKIINKPPKEK